MEFLWLWLCINFLFFVCIGMTAATLFTPRTALFFREKSRRKGVALWLGMAIACVVLSNAVVPEQFRVKGDWISSFEDDFSLDGCK